MESEFARTQKELSNLQYLNKFLLMSEKKKDDMISYLFEENRALKNEVLELQKFHDKLKNKNPKITNQIMLDSSFLNPSLNPKLTNASLPSQHNLNNLQIKKPSIFSLAALNENTPKKKIKIYEDNLAYKNLLNMNISNYFTFL